MDNQHRHLAYFPGVKGENLNFLGGFISELLQDNISWRHDNYPEGNLSVNESIKNDLKSEYDVLSQNVSEMITEMRKNLPFYSPRYIGHMLSDTTLPALIGYMAGLLYNPNNVTTEAATVTVDWEIQVCNRILEMLGYTKAPEVDLSNKNFNMDQYKKSLEKTFGWAHITSGGTSSNIEALWVARNVKYMALAIRDVAVHKELDIMLEQANGIKKSIREFEEREVLFIKPADAIGLLNSYLKAAFKKLESQKVTGDSIEHKVWDWLNQSKLSFSKGTGNVFEKYPPVVFVSGAGHYSIDKAADLLGIGKENVQHVRMDSRFRMDMGDLERKIRKTLLQGKIPLAVIAIAGTTEEGAVDPIHDIVKLRSEYEMNNNTSFWLHIDGAWGGYMRTLFTPAASMKAFIGVSKLLGITYEGDLSEWNRKFFLKVEERAAQFNAIASEHEGKQLCYSKELRLLNDLVDSKDQWTQIAEKSDMEAYLNKISCLNEQNKGIWIFSPLDKLDVALDDSMELIMSFVHDKVRIEHGNYKNEIEVRWDDKGVLSSYMAFSAAESITIDAHKMGYVPYSCGIIAYKNDRVRNFIQQEAPYITDIERKSPVHYPPKHIVEKPCLTVRNPEDRYSTVIDSFAPFTLEGSKSGASACSLWLAVKTIPLTLGHHGEIVKSTLMAARELYEWISHWNEINMTDKKGKYMEFELIPLVKHAPDTNVINFIVKNRKAPSLKAANDISMQVYKSFGVNMGNDGGDSRSRQPFFLSKTKFEAPMYPFSNLFEFFQENRIENAYKEYNKNGLFVLRATVMNPYIHLMNKNSDMNYFKEFMEAISQVAERYMDECRDEAYENKI